MLHDFDNNIWLSLFIVLAGKRSTNASLLPVVAYPTLKILQWYNISCVGHFVLNFWKKESESAKYSKHLINRVLHGAPITEVIFYERRKASACLINAERQAR